MSKPASKHVPSDDCAVLSEGQVYYPHEGEWVELIPMLSAGELRILNRLSRVVVELQAVTGEPGEGQKKLAILDDHLEPLTEYLASRVIAWNWTDAASRPLPQPDGTPGPLRRLSAEELVWLVNAGQETKTERKNGLRPSETTSSAIASPATVGSRFTGGRNRMNR